MSEACSWTADHDTGMWDTQCGEAFVFECDGPRENGMRFCCFCGKGLEAKAAPIYVEQDEEIDADDLSSEQWAREIADE